MSEPCPKLSEVSEVSETGTPVVSPLSEGASDAESRASVSAAPFVRSVRPFQTPIPSPLGRSYFGGKGAEATVRTIINQIPPHRRFVELFLGGGAVVRHKRPADINEALELDLDTFTMWKRAAPPWLHVQHADALLWLRTNGPSLGPDVFLFIDPPYLAETLRDPRHLQQYGHSLTTEQHAQLLAMLQPLRCMVMVCALPNLFYEHHLSTWRVLQYRNVTRTYHRHGHQVEQLWLNYPEPKRLHDYRYVGADFRRREHLARLRKSIARLSPLERRAVLATHHP